MRSRLARVVLPPSGSPPAVGPAVAHEPPAHAPAVGKAYALLYSKQPSYHERGAQTEMGNQSFSNFSFLGRNRMDNLLSHHNLADGFERFALHLEAISRRPHGATKRAVSLI